MRLFYSITLTLLFIMSEKAPARPLIDVVSFAIEAMDTIDMAQVSSRCIEADEEYRPWPLDPKFKSRGADCSAFIGENGYGPYGLELIKKFDELGECSPLLLSHNDLGEMCPRWKLLNLDERKNFWVNAFAAIAWAESTCIEDAKAPGVHGTAIGLLQLNASRSNRSWRGPDCDAPEIMPAKHNLRCGVDIMNELMKEKTGMYKSVGLVGRKSNSYWQELRRPHGGLIGKRIKTFRPCFEP